MQSIFLCLGDGTVAGWGLTGLQLTGVNPVSCAPTLADIPSILQETTMRVCSEEEAAAFPVSANQICAVGFETSVSQVVRIRRRSIE